MNDFITQKGCKYCELYIFLNLRVDFELNCRQGVYQQTVKLNLLFMCFSAGVANTEKIRLSMLYFFLKGNYQNFFLFFKLKKS